jgi:hypothetical protein
VRGEPGSQVSETFTDVKLMQAFKAAVETQGHVWPAGWLPGRGWIANDSEPVPAGSMIVYAVYALWLDNERQKISLNRKKAASVGRDTRIYDLYIRPDVR